MQRIHVYPGFDALYCSFYMEGIHALFRPGQIHYTCAGFPPFGGVGMALILEGATRKKIYIAPEDAADLNPMALDWCDIYAKVNVDPLCRTTARDPRIMPIGPAFGVRVWSSPRFLHEALRTFRLCHINMTPREHFANYFRQYRYRLPAAGYAPGPSSPDYIFFGSSIWKGEPQTNQHRAAFMAACKSQPGVRFEGGFFPRRDNDVPGFEEHTNNQWYPLREYVSKLRASAVAFNTPVVYGCLSWHFGEFFALGKAIISTPLGREMPAPLVHGTHIHFVDGGTEAMREAVARICRDDAYRHRLEQGASTYYREWLQPRRVIERLLTAAAADQWKVESGK